MIVCLCEAVTDAAVRAARDAGARTVEAIGAATGAGTDCGSCREAIARILLEPAGAGEGTRRGGGGEQEHCGEAGEGGEAAAGHPGVALGGLSPWVRVGAAALRRHR